MSPFLKKLADLVLKPGADAVVADLKANEAADIAKLEADVAAGGALVPTVVSFFTGKIKTNNPIVAEAEALALPPIESEITSLLGNAEQNIPALYAAGLTYFEKVDSEL